MASNRAAPADGRAWQGSRGRPARDQRHPPCSQERLAVVRLPAGIRPTDADLQSLRTLGGAWRMGTAVPRACQTRPIGRGADDRLDAHQGTPLGFGRKKGERSQAIGRSRGGRNTKIHAIADAKGRLLSILLSGGEAHDCPPAKRLIRRTKPARKLLGDRAYDSAPLRQWLTARAPGLSSQTSRTANNLSASTGNPTNGDTASRMPSAGSKISDASPPATTGSPEIFSPPSASSLLRPPWRSWAHRPGPVAGSIMSFAFSPYYWVTAPTHF